MDYDLIGMVYYSIGKICQTKKTI